ncbi:MAG: DNA polymerase III subunit alpha [Candidatus Latescibacteria bacterium]|nr:DNA polymerase III subunit alpha [Candidatus Latescibacterota bacterium]NIM21029.1 DNA polymerase III subunit alpha [Candidatus Latescibacterota bacterium]NIM65164.1 DNA polymerase III subunit alpha [Candidatus Latescibacterota bacterium]NIO01679.1 DNA polymerase III subunit alpha [Candidatus Latescibacterota bacterium]NIO28196.1 DNA polymerase III subunit alpha [Candidatus Latescibacterota bacterium]
MPSRFVHLHTHSEYSLLDGSIKIKNLVNRAKKLDMHALALTDHGNMFGAVKFYRTARAASIKPIIGMETYITRGSRFDRGRKKGEQTLIDHLILLARNNHGYRNLIRLASAAYIEGFYYKPRIDFEALEAHSDGLIALSSCMRGVVAQAALASGLGDAQAKAERLRSMFGDENFYLEIQDHGIREQKLLREALWEISLKTGIPLVVTNDVHYLNREDAEAHEVLLCLQTGSDLEDPRRFRFQSKDLYFKSESEMVELFSDMPEAVENSVAIAERCHVELDKKRLHLPEFPLPEGYDSSADYLKHLAYEGAKKLFDVISDEIKERLEYELAVIEKMDFPGYFLIVGDIVNHAKKMGIPVGPGRGSAAGSLVTYALGITDLNPLEHGLLFERMLNPERVSMPDIDIDFCFERRDEVIKYVIDRYSEENVCQIITFGTMAARGVVRDVGRVLKIPYSEVDRIAKLIPGQPGTTLREAIDSVPDLKRLIEGNETYKRLIDFSLVLEGLTRHASTHAAGMVITPTPLVNHIPLYRSNRGEVTTQYDMKSIEAVGLLKIDLLGLRTLTVIDKTIRMVDLNHGKRILVEEIPIDDERTFKLLREARTVGVFQLESSGMRELLKNLQPGSFQDVVAVNALYRPGPLGSDMLSYFCDCKHGRTKISYAHPMLKPILEETYGVILYQEQVMEIASRLAGFTMGEADLLRKAMGKKDQKVMGKQRKKFVKGAAEKGIPKLTAEKIFGQMEKFALYGFNKSHSAAYALISLRTAYLKANYTAEFMAANLTSEMDNSDRILILLDDSRSHGIEIVPPDINVCAAEFRAREGKIYFGLAAVKNVGAGAMAHVAKEREENGPYVSLFDLCSRVGSRIVNRRVFESLIQSGALDALPGHRAEKLHNLDKVMEHAIRRSKDKERGQIPLDFKTAISPYEKSLEPCAEWSTQEKLRNEREALGFFLSGHPLDKFRALLGMIATMSTTTLKGSSNGKHAVIGGLVSQVKTTFDKKQNPMAFVTIEDAEGQAEAVVFSDVLEKSRGAIHEDRVLILQGKVSRRNGGEGKLLVNSVLPVDDEHVPASKEIHISIDMDNTGHEVLENLKRLLSGHQGEVKLFFDMRQKGKRACVIRSRSLCVKLDHELISRLTASVGADNVKLIPGSSRV